MMGKKLNPYQSPIFTIYSNIQNEHYSFTTNLDQNRTLATRLTLQEIIPCKKYQKSIMIQNSNRTKICNVCAKKNKKFKKQSKSNFNTNDC